MGARTDIEWADASWSPVRARNLKTGKIGWHCEHITTGCEFCYAEGINKRLGTGLPFKPGHREHVKIFLDEKMLRAPLRWRKPRRIFVCSMTDLFADFVTDEMIDKMFAVMALCPQHTFQVLTKRPARMFHYMSHICNRDDLIAYRALLISGWPQGAHPDRTKERLMGIMRRIRTPMPNVWLGVSAERQEEWDDRIKWLRETPAAIRFVSAEPLLGSINPETFAGIDWLIVGGESGPHARPMQIEWAQSIVSQCKTSGVACFVKQLGAFATSDGYPLHYSDSKGGDWTEWPDALRVREFPDSAAREVAA